MPTKSKTTTPTFKTKLARKKHVNQTAALRREIEVGVKRFWDARGGHKGYSSRGGAL